MTIEEQLKKLGQEEAKRQAKIAREKLCKEYFNTIDRFYAEYDPENSTHPYYRNYKLRKSYIPYYKDNGHGVTYWGGVQIGAMRMSDYPQEKGIRGKEISADNLFNTFIYYNSALFHYGSTTYHGGDYHGGYGRRASFSIYEHMHVYHEKLKDEFRSGKYSK